MTDSELRTTVPGSRSPVPGPLVSVIIPVFNGAKYVGDAIESVLAQTYHNHEIIVVDDGSVDDSWAVIQSYVPKVRALHKENGGVSSALNLGIRQSTGEFVAWLSHDDVFLPAKLERQVDFLARSPRFRACYTDYRLITSEGDLIAEISTPWYPRDQAIRKLFAEMYIGGSTILFERSLYDAVGPFAEHWRLTSDAEMWFRMLSVGDIGRVAEVLLKERCHETQQVNLKPTGFIAEKKATYCAIYDRLGATVFQESGAAAEARSHAWFADTMFRYQGWWDVADRYYAEAIAAWPSIRNPARFRRALAQCRRYLSPVVARMRRRENGRPVTGDRCRRPS
jgi:glycosyltransferase involved in cell wall biosynthesis